MRNPICLFNPAQLRVFYRAHKENGTANGTRYLFFHLFPPFCFQLIRHSLIHFLGA